MSEPQTTPQEEQRARFTTSIETRLLYQRIRKMQVGDVVSYGELSSILGADVRLTGRSALYSARQIAERDDTIVTEAVPNVGIKRLSDSENILSAGAVFTKIRRAANRGVSRLTALQNFDALSDTEKTLHNASVSALAVVKMMAKPKSVERIAGAVNTTNTGQLPIARTLELFRGPKPAG